MRQGGVVPVCYDHWHSGRLNAKYHMPNTFRDYARSKVRSIFSTSLWKTVVRARRTCFQSSLNKTGFRKIVTVPTARHDSRCEANLSSAPMYGRYHLFQMLYPSTEPRARRECCKHRACRPKADDRRMPSRCGRYLLTRRVPGVSRCLPPLSY